MNWLKQQAANIAGTAEPIYGPSALHSVAKQAEKTPYTELTKDDLRWKCMDSTNVETQTFYLMADSGHIGMAQVIYSNVAGLRTTVQFNSKISYPNGEKPHLWCSDPVSNHGFDADQVSFFADGCSIDLNEAGDQYTIKSAVNEKCLVNIKISRKTPGFQVGIDGSTYYGKDEQNPWGSMRHRFWPRCDLEGTYTTKDGVIDFKGRAMLSHALQGMKPHHAAAKWDFVNFQTPTYSALLMEFTTPPSYGSSKVAVGGIATDDGILFASADCTVKHVEFRADPDWPEPDRIEFHWKGQTKDGKAVTAELTGNLGDRLDKIDVMAEVPGFIKNIVGGVVGTRPYIFQYSPKKGTIQLKVRVEGEEEKSESGTYFGEATFISE